MEKTGDWNHQTTYSHTTNGDDMKTVTLKGKDLIKELNHFLSLEYLQVTLYQRGLNAVDDSHWQQGLRRLVDIEEGHVARLRKWVLEAGGTPNDTNSIAIKSLGAIGAEAAEVVGFEAVITIGILVENKATQMYHDAIVKWVEPKSQLAELLWGNLVQEEMHAMWLRRWIDSRDDEIFQISPS